MGGTNCHEFHRFLTVEKECLGCESGVDSDSTHTFATGCSLADDSCALRPSTFTQKPSPLSRGGRLEQTLAVKGAKDLVEYNHESKGGFHRVKTVSPVIASSEYQVKWADGTTPYVPANEFEYSHSAKKLGGGSIALVVSGMVSDDESVVSDTVDTDSEWDPADDESDVSDTVDTDSELDTSVEDKVDSDGGLGCTGSKRKRMRVVRFADEVYHIPAGWSGEAGSNNGFRRGGMWTWVTPPKTR